MMKWSKVELIWAITCTSMHEFQNNMAELFSLTSRIAICKIYSGRFKVKVKHESKMVKWL